MTRAAKRNPDGNPLVLPNELSALLYAVHWLEGFAAACPSETRVPSPNLLQNIYFAITEQPKP